MSSLKTGLIALACVLVTQEPQGRADQSSTPDSSENVVVRAMKDELTRSLEKLRIASMASPYYVAYVVDDVDGLRFTASYGALTERGRERSRTATVDLRVGDARLDNSGSTYQRPEQLPVDDDYNGIRHELWLATDRAYKDAVEGLERKRSLREGRTPHPDRVADFSQEKPARTIGRAAQMPAVDAAEPLVIKLSALLKEFPDIHDSRAGLAITTRTRYVLTTEGTLSIQPSTIVQLMVVGRTQADDGMRLDHAVVHTVSNLGQLPSEADLVRETRRMAEELTGLRKAPVVEDYDGPILFESSAAARLLRPILEEELSGTLPPEGMEGRGSMRGAGESDWAGKVGKRVLPKGFEIVDDPLASRTDKTPLLGSYAADDEGMPAQRVLVVGDGLVKTLLMSRSPRKGLEHSNGHGRGSRGGVRATPSNVFVTARRGVSDAALRKQLLATARKAGLPHAIVVRNFGEPGFTGFGERDAMRDATTRGDTPLPSPALVYRVTPDGKEELVRGVFLSGINAASLEKILAAGRSQATYSYLGSGRPGLMGYYVGGGVNGQAIPSSISAPALLFESVQVRHPKHGLRKPPVYPRAPFSR